MGTNFGRQRIHLDRIDHTIQHCCTQGVAQIFPVGLRRAEKEASYLGALECHEDIEMCRLRRNGVPTAVVAAVEHGHVRRFLGKFFRASYSRRQPRPIERLEDRADAGRAGAWTGLSSEP